MLRSLCLQCSRFGGETFWIKVVRQLLEIDGERRWHYMEDLKHWQARSLATRTRWSILQVASGDPQEIIVSILFLKRQGRPML
jgi:hypothetical protein